MDAPTDLPLNLVLAHSLREIDAALGRPKGSAFRAFKSLPLREGVDFYVLHPDRDGPAFTIVQARGQLYPGAQRAILVSDEARRRIEQVLKSSVEVPDG
jgi:hypothetical protein